MRAFVLMKALVPTTGHRDLINFAARLASEVIVIIDTAKGEPMVQERLAALREHYRDNRAVRFGHVNLDQEDPESEGFWDLWRGILLGMGLKPDDVVVGSEPYCKKLAQVCGVRWYPYDVDRQINPTRGTNVRSDIVMGWDEILPEFRPHLQIRVTIFGAESCGKTTLSKELGNQFPDSYVLPEYARPYLEQTENVITIDSMTAIWKGQRALQDQPWIDQPLIIQDTDLYSTLGYWQYWANHIDWEVAYKGGISVSYAGARLPEYPPQEVREDAKRLQSDLYIVCPSKVQFEPDPLRYGGDKREIDDGWWTSFLSWQKPYPNYRVLTSDPDNWVWEAADLIDTERKKKAALIKYQRPAQ